MDYVSKSVKFKSIEWNIEGTNYKAELNVLRVKGQYYQQLCIPAYAVKQTTFDEYIGDALHTVQFVDDISDIDYLNDDYDGEFELFSYSKNDGYINIDYFDALPRHMLDEYFESEFDVPMPDVVKDLTTEYKGQSIGKWAEEMTVILQGADRFNELNTLTREQICEKLGKNPSELNAFIQACMWNCSQITLDKNEIKEYSTEHARDMLHEAAVCILDILPEDVDRCLFGKRLTTKDKDYNMALEKAMYSLYKKYDPETVKKHYPTFEEFFEADKDARFVFTSDLQSLAGKAIIDQKVSPWQFVEEAEMAFNRENVDACERVGRVYGSERTLKGVIEVTVLRGIEVKAIRSDWEGTLKKYTVNNITELSHKIDYGFSKEDISELARLHKNGGKKMKEKIETLLTDCNFHSDCALMVNGKYDKLEKLMNDKPKKKNKPAKDRTDD